MGKQAPDIFLFNPTCEYAVANGHPSWQPNLLLQKMEEDLGTLPLFLARPHDVVLVKKLPPPEFPEQLKKAGLIMPQFIKTEDAIKNKAFIDSPKSRLLPWGWSPAAHKLLSPLKSSCSAEFTSSPVAEWRSEYKQIYSKKFALEILKDVLPLLPGGAILPPHLIPETCTTRQELEILINKWGKLMVKAPWSSSGRGLQRVTTTPVAPKVWEKLLGIINEQGFAMAEPYLNKILDMALQFRIKNGKVTYLGISRFFTDKKGQYQGNFLNGWPVSTEQQATDFLESFIEILIPRLSMVVEGSLLAEYYEGVFGIDTLLFQDSQDLLRINPCLEINVRQNMGLLSLKLEKLLAPGKKALFKIFFQKEKSFYSFQKEMETRYPLVVSNNKIKSGFFPLTPTDENYLFGAYILADI